jgi:hypothetical protein
LPSNWGHLPKPDNCQKWKAANGCISFVGRDGEPSRGDPPSRPYWGSHTAVRLYQLLSERGQLPGTSAPLSLSPARQARRSLHPPRGRGSALPISRASRRGVGMRVRKQPGSRNVTEAISPSQIVWTPGSPSVRRSTKPLSRAVPCTAGHKVGGALRVSQCDARCHSGRLWENSRVTRFISPFSSENLGNQGVFSQHALRRLSITPTRSKPVRGGIGCARTARWPQCH